MKNLVSKAVLTLVLAVGATLSLSEISKVKAQNDWPNGQCRGCVCSMLTSGGNTFYGCGGGDPGSMVCCYPNDVGPCTMMECPGEIG